MDSPVAFHLKEFAHSQCYLGHHLFPLTLFREVVLHIYNTVRFFSHLLNSTLGFPDLLKNDFLKFVCTKVHSLCGKDLWVWACASVTCPPLQYYTEQLIDLKIPCASFTYSIFLDPKLLTATYLLAIFVFLSFPGCHINGIMQQVAFQTDFFYLAICI